MTAALDLFSDASASNTSANVLAAALALSIHLAGPDHWTDAWYPAS